MAKKEQEFQYGSSFLPQGEKKYSVIRWGWNGLNKEDTIDTGQLTKMYGMICDPPYMITEKQPKVWIDFSSGIPCNNSTVDDISRAPGKPISIAGFDNQLAMVWEYTDNSGDNPVYRPMLSRFLQSGDDIYINQSYFADSNVPLKKDSRSMVQFNVVDTSSGNIVNYTYDRKILVYPDCYSVPYIFYYPYGSGLHPQGSWAVTASSFNTDGNPIPVPNYSAVYQSRVFGTNKNATFASDYNSYAAYNLDTADDVSSAHAWWSMTNSNTEADGEITAICTFDNHVVIFKKDFMQLVYNNKNPFRIVDVGAYGCASDKAWTILNGVLYFAAHEKIYAYTGGVPKEISLKLDIDDFSKAILGSYKDTLYVYISGDMYTYKDGVWSFVRQTIGGEQPYIIRQFATLDFGLVALVEYLTSSSATNYYKLLLFDWDTNFLESQPNEDGWKPNYSDEWYFETDLMALGKLDVRRVKKFTVLCEGKEGAEIDAYLLPDGVLPDEEYNVCSYKFERNGMKILRVLTRQFSGTMHRLRFVGKGYVKFYAAELKISWGGDVYVEG